MLIKGNDANKKIVGPMKISEYKISSDFSGSLVVLDSEHGKIKNAKEDRIYFIIEGEGQFEIKDKKFEVSKEDLIFVPKNTLYSMRGKMKYLLICSPEFNAKNDIFL